MRAPICSPSGAGDAFLADVVARAAGFFVRAAAPLPRRDTGFGDALFD